jgi:hypothetical protein
VIHFKSLQQFIFTKNIDLFSYVSIAFVLAIKLPLTVPYDGFNYLSSGSSLFTSNFPEWYQIMREPAYPLIVKVATLFPNTILALTMIQAFMVGASITILNRICIQHLKMRSYTAHIISIVGLLLIRGYASSVLQQSLIILLSMLGLYLSLMMEKDHPIRNKFGKFFLYGLAIAATNMALLVSASVSIILVVLLKKNSQFIRQAVVPLFLGSAMLLVPWYSFVYNVELNQQNIPSFRNASEIDFFGDDSFLQRNQQRVQSVAAMLFLAPEIGAGIKPESSTIGSEQLIFGSPINNSAWDPCFRDMGGQPEVVDYVRELLIPRCISKFSLKIQDLISFFLLPVLPISGLTFVMAIGHVPYLRRTKNLSLLLLPLCTLAIYAFGGAGVTRYSPLVPVLGPVLLFLIFRANNTKKV